MDKPLKWILILIVVIAAAIEGQVIGGALLIPLLLALFWIIEGILS